MTQLIALVLAVAKALPIIDKWLGELFNAYQVQKKKEVQAETERVINEGIKNQDQRKIESDQTSGKPSRMGSVRDSLPNVGLRDKGKG
ncbi:MAG: hypothetical protein HUM72_12630 [Dolichospermum sp.]|nr:hypothetical protein [Dolichospermum sp.]